MLYSLLRNATSSVEYEPPSNIHYYQKTQNNHMTNTSDLETIRQELHELRLLYKKIAEQHIPTEGPTPEDTEALDSEDVTVGEEEIRKALKRSPPKK